MEIDCKKYREKSIIVWIFKSIIQAKKNKAFKKKKIKIESSPEKIMHPLNRIKKREILWHEKHVHSFLNTLNFITFQLETYKKSIS